MNEALLPQHDLGPLFQSEVVYQKWFIKRERDFYNFKPTKNIISGMVSNLEDAFDTKNQESRSHVLRGTT